MLDRVVLVFASVRLLALALMATAMAGSVLSCAATSAPNDLFAQATPLTGSSNHIATRFTGPTIEPNEPLETNSIQGTLWWSWTAPSEGRAVVTPNWVTVGTNQFGEIKANSKIAVYSGPALDQLTPVGYRSWNIEGQVIFHAHAGTTYYLQAWARENNENEPTEFWVELFPFGPVLNDQFGMALELETQRWFTPRSVIGATRQFGEPAHGDGAPGKTLWWKYAAVANLKSAVIEPGFGTLTNFTTAIYLGDTVENLRLVARGRGPVPFEAWALETYRIAVEVDADQDGDVAIGLTEGPPVRFTHEVAGNLAANPSFERLGGQGFADWSGQFGGGIINNGGPDGANFALLNTPAIWQDIATIPGATYRLQFVYVNAQAYDSELSVKFGGSPARFTLPWTNQAWRAADLLFRTDSAVTRLEFRGGVYTIGLDQVVLRQMEMPAPPQFGIANRRADQTISWPLFGPADFRSVIERRVEGGDWQPVQIIQGQNGEANFTANNEVTNTIVLYRARPLN